MLCHVLLINIPISLVTDQCPVVLIHKNTPVAFAVPLQPPLLILAPRNAPTLLLFGKTTSTLTITDSLKDKTLFNETIALLTR